MARIFTSGFEINKLQSGWEWNTVSGSVSLSSTVKRSGNYSLRVNPTSATGSVSIILFSSTTSNLYCRFYLYIASAPTANTLIARASNGGSQECGIVLKTDRTLQGVGQTNDNTIGSPSSPLALNTWYRVEFWFNNSGASTGSSNFRLNGTTFASHTASSPDIDDVDQFDFGVLSATTCDIYFDDIAINDTAGTNQNSWPGEGSVVALFPNGDSSVQWSTVVPSTPTTHYDKIKGDSLDDNTSYIQTATLGHTDVFTLDDFTPSAQSITLVSTHLRWNNPFSSTASIFVGLGDGTYTNNGQTLDTASLGTWVTNTDHNQAGGVDFRPGLTIYKQLDGTSALTTTYLNSLLLRIVTGDSDTYRVTAAWALVEYVASTGTSVNDSRAAKVRGQQTASAERSAKIKGYAITTSERGAKVTGIAGANSERAAKTKGIATAISERGAKLRGQQTANSERGAKIKGYGIGTSDRGAKIKGFSTASSDRGARVRGGITTSDSRGGKIKGYATSTSERSAKIKGYATANSERAGKIKGYATSTSERSGKIKGYATITSERGAKLRGQQTATSERGAKIKGVATSSSSISGKVRGQQMAQDQRSAKVRGQQTANSERGARIFGVIVSDRDARIRGSVTTMNERAAKLRGQASASDTRGGKVKGINSANDTRGAKLRGQASATSERGAKIKGYAMTTSERAGKVRGSITTTNERAAKLRGQQVASESRAGAIRGRQDGSDNRQAKLKGYAVTTNERAAKLKGFATTSAERGGKITGQGAPNISSERAAKITGGQLITYNPKIIFVEGRPAIQLSNNHYIFI